MQLLYAYKDYGNPGFYQSPKYNFLKEASFGNAPKHIRQQHEAEASKCFDYVQESFLYGDRYEGEANSPLVLQKFESADYGDESPRMVVHIHSKPVQTIPSSNNERGGHNNRRGGGAQGNGQRNAPVREHPHDAFFDIGKERNKGNQFWKQGKGREEHRASEISAK